MSDTPEQLRIFVPAREFIIPYIAREFPDRRVIAVDSPENCSMAILSPDDTVNTDNAVTTLVCPNVVGTGMTGLPMDFARRIARGSFYHLGDNQARLSTIHASDVAKAVKLALDVPGKFVVTDGDDPTYHDFAEALAWRINHKRILTLNSKWVNWIISPALKRIITKDNVVDGSEFAERFNFIPTPVTEYLRTHIYDDESL